jgi:hypothetical protein
VIPRFAHPKEMSSAVAAWQDKSLPAGGLLCMLSGGGGGGGARLTGIDAASSWHEANSCWFVVEMCSYAPQYVTCKSLTMK